MEKASELRPEELQANPLLQDLLERARAGGEPVLRYQGLTVVLQPVEDITHTFSHEDLARFAENYRAAENPSNRLSAAEAIARFQRRTRRNS